MTGQTPLANDFGLTCTYTHTGGITQTVSASNVLNASFETFNYGSLPAGWSVHSPGSTFYAATDNSYHGSYSLQYQPNPSRMFAQACRSVQIDTDAQSVAAGVYYAGGTNGTSDVTILLDGSVLGTTLVSGLAPWAPLVVTDTFSSTTQFHTLCVEVEGANRAYIDAVWLYASETNDLSGLICPAPEDNVVPPPPPPPPENDEDGIPVPAPEDLGTCYRCIKPISILQIGSWIKWLFCGLANLFRCELWLWLLQIQNIAAAIFGSFGLFIAWLPGAFQSWIDWGAGAVGGVASWFVGIWDAFRNGFTLFLSGLVQRFLETEFIQDIWAGLTMGRGLAEFLIGIARAFMAMLQALYDAVSQLVELIRGFVAAVAAAWNAEPYQFDFIPGQGAGSGGSGPGITGPELLEADGINNSKIYWLLVVSLLAVDDVAGSFGLQYLQWIAIGILSLGLIGWTFTKWHDPVPT